MKKIIILCLLLSTIQLYANKNASAIYVELQKLNSLDKILYIAAHPDDENTRALAWFSLGLHAQTAYFSLTRGDGGQNLIGKELSEDLGVLRTQELLAARAYDDAEQYFSRAVDFGFSKSADESLEKWGKDKILADAVLMIRKFQPTVIITRFPPDERAGHGHHIASALIAIEAFNKAADPNFLPEQVKEFGTWQATSIYWNSSTWSNPNVAKEAIDNPNYLIKDIGGYNELLGMSYNEIGTIARSQHKCQGFGAIIERGSQLEYFEYLAGAKLEKDFFEKNTATWASILNKNAEQKLQQILSNFDFISPENNVSAMFGILTELEQLPNSIFKEKKIESCKQIILDCLGLNIEMVSNYFAITNNDSTSISLNIINRSYKNVILKSIEGNNFNQKTFSKKLNQNEKVEEKISFVSNEKISTPYWLEQPFVNTFVVDDKNNLLKAENDATFLFNVDLTIEDQNIQVQIPLEYKEKDPSYGERRREAVSTPDFTVNFNEKSIILREGQSKTIEIKIHSFKKNIDTEISLIAPTGWKISQSKIPVKFKNKQEELFVKFVLTPTINSEKGALKITNTNGENIMSYTEIAYDHIPTQVIFKPSQLECVKLDAKIIKGKIAYIKGAEDLVPEAIAQLGFDVEVFNVSDLSALDLSKFESVVLGIRIYNVYEEMKNFDSKLFAYVENGGNLIMQYNTAARNSGDIKYGGPLPFEISKNRVTEEEAKVDFLLPNHPILNYPNKITQKDFDNWVQERGLYFADNWDKKFTPLLSWHDKGEDAKLGALIVAQYGKGQIVYTGISFFRELPNGVEGAYRLFANILSYKHGK